MFTRYIVCLEIVGLAFCLRFGVLHMDISEYCTPYYGKLAVSSSVYQCLFSGDVPDPKPWKRNYTNTKKCIPVASHSNSQVPASLLQSDKARGDGNGVIIDFFSRESPGISPILCLGPGQCKAPANPYLPPFIVLVMLTIIHHSLGSIYLEFSLSAFIHSTFTVPPPIRLRLE